MIGEELFQAVLRIVQALPQSDSLPQPCDGRGRFTRKAGSDGQGVAA